MWMGLFQNKVIFSYVRCSDCGLLFAPVFFDEPQLQELYSSMPPNMDVVPVDALSRTQAGYYKYFEAVLPKEKGSFLEIGPDVGLFTKHCARIELFDKYWLFEPNKSVFPQLEALMSGRRCNIFHEYSDFSVVPDDSVSACVTIHVLDHLLCPHETLVQLRQKMKKSAVLMIVTHDEGSVMARMLGVKWPAYCLQHPQLYNRKSIRAALANAGFRVTKQVKTRNFFPVSFLVKNLLWSLGARCEVPNVLSSAVVGLKLGNILTLGVPA